jgi:hypothetical protein
MSHREKCALSLAESAIVRKTMLQKKNLKNHQRKSQNQKIGGSHRFGEKIVPHLIIFIRVADLCHSDTVPVQTSHFPSCGSGSGPVPFLPLF